MAARPRKPGESYESYRESLRKQAIYDRHYLRGQMVYVSAVYRETPVPGATNLVRKHKMTNPPAIVHSRDRVDITKRPFDRYYAPARPS